MPLRILATGLSQFAFMLRSGLQVSVALGTLSDQPAHPVLGQVLADVRTLVESGHRLSYAFGRQPHVFPPMVVMMVQAGEETGDLWGRIQRASETLLRQAQHQARLRQALSTPLFTAAVSAVVLVALVKLVVPRFSEMYRALGIELPLLTRMASGLVTVINHPSFPAALLMLAALIVMYKATLKRWIFQALLRTPWTRELLGAVMAQEFCDILSSLYTSGVPLNRALTLLAGASVQESYRDMLLEVRHKVEEGHNLAEAVRLGIPFFPRLVSGMLEVGSVTGALDKSLGSVDRVLALEVESRLQFVQASLEPLLMAVLGVTLATFFMALMLPMYGMLSKLGF